MQFLLKKLWLSVLLACPIGTYKSRLEPAKQCTPCPPGSTTARAASGSIRDCVCKEGYEGDPTNGLPCSPVKCPPLQKPKHGFTLGSCRDSAVPFRSDCGFLCDQEYELVNGDSAIRTCLSNGSWSGKSAVCKRIQCKRPSKPDFGVIQCDRGSLMVGSKCRYSCHRGYMREGSEERQCLSSKRWSGTEVTCTPVRCELPPQLRHGSVYGCKTNERPEYQESCVFRCNEGFKLEGPEALVCKEDGKLMEENNKAARKPSCVDVTPPELTCPLPVEVGAAKGSKGAVVNWRIPQPTDNSGIVPKLLSQPANIFPGVYLEIGHTFVNYTAVDYVGHKKSCNFEIVVFDDEEPTVVSCPSKVEVSSDDVLEPAFWKEPVFEDNSGRPVRIRRTHLPGDTFSPGRHTVTYEAYDPSNNMATCKFDVIMTRNTCPYYPPPTNGALSCDDWSAGQFCQVLCNDKHDFVEKPSEWYICNEKSVWVTIPDDGPIPWPDCATMSIPSKVRHMMHGFYYHGDCNDPQVQMYIKKVFLRNLFNKFQEAELCANQGRCNVNTVRVLCGKTTDHVSRRRRDVWDQLWDKEELELEFEITIDVDHEVNDTEAVLQNFLETIQNLKWDMDEDFDLQLTTLAPYLQSDSAISDRNESISGTAVFTGGETVMECKPGSVYNNDLCVLCSPGTFYEASMKECLDCPLGYYQEEEGQISCERCPEGMTTEYGRARNITECKGICLPGTYSPTRVETCLACPVGTYQELKAQTSCSVCPNGTTTASSRSVSEADCKNICEAGYFSHSGLQPCRPCPKGFYQSLAGQTMCIECSATFSTPDEASKDASDCLDLDPCAEEGVCDNGGLCTRVGREAQCSCQEGFQGSRCEQHIDECEQHPCFNDGVCIDLESSYYCNCSEGFTGPQCEEEVDECLSSPCMNNGTCLDKVNDYSCLCPAGFESPRCEGAQEMYCSLDVDECANVTCFHNGRCVDEIASFKCICEDGYTGLLCEIEINECENHQCWFGSTCHDLVGRYECLCPPGWSGQYCETKLNADFVLNFPESTATIANMASMTLDSPLSDVTVSMWVQTTDTKRSGTPLSYAAASVSTTDGENTIVDNALTINDCSGVHIYVNNEPLVTEVQVADGQWHHLAFTWSSGNSGEWTLYKDGKKQSNGINLRPNDVIPGGGNLIIGQEQDTVGGGFSPIETFTGNITRVNVWNSYFSNSNITRLCSLDDDIPGKVVSWPDFLQGVRGKVNVLHNERPL
ncbi:sushi, von Willebrand factor type A, EGF and pentraxin domain-containing protein 1 [Caerostris darwini]|uniref:Sushi, von Willebrand factor type A, EGF and pentraxin domain-containing protein 1 n=1 Tax=Caerostris darwini TaxID=1538125 RepID=A0AAV4UT00_9ARAC|nr:sushi, von Willebrand factor type A, EGF and pentraxin domain-containing protein 1 [Caerostris darwini]